MFSTIGNIITGQQKPREAETADTRLDIQRHDPDAEQRKKESQDDDVNALLSEDDAEVSIEALYIFLENFLQSQIDKAKKAGQPKTASPDIPAPPQQQTPPPQSKAAMAINAYTQAAEVTQPKSAMDQKPAPSTQEMDIESDEVRMIHALLVDLKTLSARGVQTLHIERDETFLLSLSHAVQKAKAKFL